MEAGLPFVATVQSELVQQCVEHGAAYPYAVGDAQSLASTLVSICRQPGALDRCGDRARELAETLSAAVTTEPLRQWVAQARAAPDRENDETNPLSHWALAGALDQVVNEREVLLREKNRLEAEAYHVKAQLGEIHTSAMWRTWAVFRRLKAMATYPWRKIRGRTGG